MRNESDLVDESVREALRIGAAGGVPVHISNHGAASRRNRGRTAQTLEMVRAARATGRDDVTVDAYPYTGGSTMLAATLPPWALDGGFGAMQERLRDGATREPVTRDLETGLPGWENLSELAGWENVVISSCRHTPTMKATAWSNWPTPAAVHPPTWSSTCWPRTPIGR